ncbi:hypothetical protein SAMN05660236_2293 [Ohtaekwangia koreensis]|uniref:Uncharacterized protein n=1 Tax=Ohtaekwangia koreensis TaxID=688867 RepID=A0A1T5KK03_9BACT|nr:hypothetical protein SAMN05660236_2293 [Ohtaekwangia koreensis]
MNFNNRFLTTSTDRNHLSNGKKKVLKAGSIPWSEGEASD